jgi:stage IV sporulation protein FA
MYDRRKEIQNRIAKRRKGNEKKGPEVWTDLVKDESDGYSPFVSYESPSPEQDHPLFKKEHFYFKLLAAACLFLLVAVLFKHPSENLDPVRGVVTETMNQEFQFAMISSWYEDAFGKPIAFLPANQTNEVAKTETGEENALPVIGKIKESFEANGEGVIIETDKDAKVEALSGGIVIFAGVKEHIGKTVVIQHSDESESWYGQLDAIEVNLYDPVTKGEEIGEVATTADAAKGTFYLAIKKNDAFIDPNQVISFE